MTGSTWRQAGAGEATKLLARIDGALMVVRTLISGKLQSDPAALSRFTAIARYCQLLATRMKIPLLDAHRLSLAAWLSTMDKPVGPMAKYIEELHLADMLGAAGSAESMEARILQLVKTFVDLRAGNPRMGRDLTLTKRALDERCPESPSQPLIRRFLNILKDEAFLEGSRAHAEQILIIDPEEAVFPLMTPVLRDEGFSVTTAGDVVAARQKMQQSRPAVIVATKDMPLIDGLSFCKEVKFSEVGAAIIFFLLCQKPAKAVERACFRAGADGIVSSPVDIELLTLQIQNMLRLRPGAAPSPEKPATGLAGDLAEISFTDLIQIVCASGKSMTLELTRNSDKGSVFIQDGAVIHATVGDKHGEAAFYAFMQWKDGTFSSHPDTRFPARTITTSIMGLLMEGSRLQDEQTPPAP